MNTGHPADSNPAGEAPLTSLEVEVCRRQKRHEDLLGAVKRQPDDARSLYRIDLHSNAEALFAGEAR